ncbi:hypothetical protein ACFOEK_12095 [Litoribrevibacter euphylliae]|uniref:DUF2141 domain-containing protein n=1 Tax=Litoribrevibacter euphylliae TaxID=1834034 RepID=A0ABV7HGB3_9GAMM
MKTYIAAIFSATALVSSVFALPASAGVDSTNVIEIINQDQQGGHLRLVTASKEGDKTLVTGLITTDHENRLPLGHIDVAAYSAQGKLIAETTASYAPKILTESSRRRGGLRFSTNALPKLPSDAVVKVAFHRNETPSNSKPKHNFNVAQ